MHICFHGAVNCRLEFSWGDELSFGQRSDLRKIYLKKKLNAVKFVWLPPVTLNAPCEVEEQNHSWVTNNRSGEHDFIFLRQNVKTHAL